MNDYDDLDEYSSGNSFRARSNTWPLNRPDLALPSAGANIDETLPEIELEDDDLFTTNENWSTGVIDHDIMSWDPILNAQNQQHQTLNQPSTVHHHHNHQQQSQLQAQQQPHTHAQHQSQHVTQPLHSQQTTQNHQRQQSIHLQNHLQQQSQTDHHQHHNHRHQDSSHHLHQHRPEQAHQHIHQHHHHHHQIAHQNDSFLDGINTSSVIITTQNAAQLQPQQSQIQHQTSPQPSLHQHIQHQTLNSVHCIDLEDSNEYHIQQLHHLHLDNNLPQINDGQRDPFAPTLTSLCVHNSATAIRNNNYNISPDPSHHQLQSLTSARYEIDQNVVEYDLKDTRVDQVEQHHHHHLNQQQNHLHEQLIHHNQNQHHEHQQHQQHTIQHHHMTSSSLDNHTVNSHILSSSLTTSGLGLSGDLEDLDYKQSVDSVNFLPNKLPEEQQQTQMPDQQQQSDVNQQSSDANDTKQSDPTPTSKAAKQNVPRRNAWGNMSYADLISQAINSTSDKRLTLSQIYDWMVQHIPYFKDKGDSNSSAGWKNSVRHNLSLHSRFKRLQNEGTGKSSWWTINPEANIGKCARRRAASMEASKYEKKRGRAKKKAEAIRQGLVSYPSLTNSSLNGSTSTLEQQRSQAQSTSHFLTSGLPQQVDSKASPVQRPELQQLDQFADSQHQTARQQPSPHQVKNRPELQIQTIDQYGNDQPSQQQQQQLQQLQQSDARSCKELNSIRQLDQSNFVAMAQHQQPLSHHQEQSHYKESNENGKIQQQQQQQQSSYYYPFELSTAL